MFTSGLVPLLSSIVGGVLVLAGQAVTRRHDDRQLWLTRLYEAAGDLATSYLEEGALVNDSRRAKKTKADVATSTYVTDRQKALGRFRTLPWADGLEEERLAMGRSIERVWDEWDSSDEEFQRAYKDARATVKLFTNAVATTLATPPRSRLMRRLRPGGSASRLQNPSS